MFQQKMYTEQEVQEIIARLSKLHLETSEKSFDSMYQQYNESLQKLTQRTEEQVNISREKVLKKFHGILLSVIVHAQKTGDKDLINLVTEELNNLANQE
jgi:glutamyl-tRNA reductase